MANVDGFGKTEKGKVIHVIVYDDKALCDKNMKGLVVNSSLSPADVTCKSCVQYTDYKQMAAGGPSPEVVKKESEPDFVDQKSGDAYKIVHKPTGKTFFDNIVKRTVTGALNNLNAIKDRWTDVNAPCPENFIGECRAAVRNAYEAHEVEVPQTLLDDGTTKKKKKKKKVEPKSKTRSYKKGERVVFNDVLKEWDGKKWITVKGEKVEKEKVEKEKPKRTIKRRGKKEKKEKRVIKRRAAESKKKTNDYGQAEGRPPYFITEKLIEGVLYSDLVEGLMENFDLSKTRAKAKIKGVIRKMTRKMGVPVMITYAKKEDDDTYEIAS